MLRIFCRIFGHHRSKRWARPTADGWRSECVLCGANLVRVGRKRWRPANSKH